MTKSTSHHDEKIAKLTLAAIYPLYLKKVEKKGRTAQELDTVIQWLTGLTSQEINQAIQDQLTFEEFFLKITLNPNAVLITGSICGYKVEEITNPLTQKIRYLDKLVDELAKGRKMEKVLRSAQ